MAPSDDIVAYQEANKVAMNYFQFTLMAGSIFISASFTIFGLSFGPNQKSLFDKSLLMCASLMPYFMFLIYDNRYTRYTHQILFHLLRTFEQQKEMEIKTHTEFHLRDRAWKKTCRFNYNILRIRTWNLTGFGALFCLWLVRIFGLIGLLSFAILVILVIAYCLAPENEDPYACMRVRSKNKNQKKKRECEQETYFSSDC